MQRIKRFGTSQHIIVHGIEHISREVGKKASYELVTFANVQHT
jgi:hypothetical protein